MVTVRCMSLLVAVLKLVLGLALFKCGCLKHKELRLPVKMCLWDWKYIAYIHIICLRIESCAFGMIILFYRGQYGAKLEEGK